jgi:hypothetical protein
MIRFALQRALLSFTRRRPFLPFEMELTSGDKFLVAHPEAVQMRGNLIYYIATTGRQRLFDSSSVCQLLDPRPEPMLPNLDDE